ncbi:MAG: HTH domain-containing protein [[Clostridium] innocuum]
MKDNISTLLDYLWHHYESWISAAELSQLLHVSTRQIRKYISILNEEHVEEPLVISTNKGYKLSSTEQYLRYRESGKHNLESRRHGRI